MEKKTCEVKRSAAETKRIRMRKLAFDSIVEMIKDASVKTSDRLSAIKLLLDLTDEKGESEDSALTVVFENLPDGFAD